MIFYKGFPLFFVFFLVVFAQPAIVPFAVTGFLGR